MRGIPAGPLSLALLLGPFFGLWLAFWAVPLGLSVDLALQNPDYLPESREAAEPTASAEGAAGSSSPTGPTSFDFLNVDWEPETAEQETEEAAPPEKYLGTENFRYVWADKRFHKALLNTALYALCVILVTLPASFLLAHFLRSTPGRLRAVLSFSLLLPGLCLPGALATLFHLFFHGREGALNQLFVVPFGFAPVNWMMDPSFILLALVLQGAWRWTGFVALFFLCAMEATPESHYEAARVEGAGPWRTLWNVTLPSVRHVALFAAVFLLVDGFASFSGAYNLLGGSGGMLDSGLLLVSYLYQVAFPGGSGRFDFPAAAAMSLSVVPLLALVTYLLLFFPGRKERPA